MRTTLGRLHVQEAGPADGPVALLWPSLFSDGETTWGTQLAGLHALGWRTLLVDPPGTGGSDPASRLFTMEECAEAALKVLDAASVDRAAFLGVSWGGMVALRVALAAPQRVIALVLSNTTARRGTFPKRLRGLMNATVARIGVPGGMGRLVVAAMLSDYSRRHNTDFATQFADGANKLDHAGLFHAVRSVDATGTSVVDALGRITAPTLVIAGEEDEVFPRPHAQELADRIPGGRLEVVPHVGHLSPGESPTAVAALLKGFLVPEGTHTS
ncbi:alpha/beta fold hydrolase [Streptomyces mirabilis]|uniref:alpha/beta fold hydrolase n=1 Tax=Streptomyces mirabilis TaxID=68239 RepID=UPI0033FE48C3